LENELKHTQSNAVRSQIVKGLLDRVQFELPETPVANTTRNVVYDIVRENSRRGVARDVIEKQKDEIYTAAAANAKEQVKLAFMVQKIVEKEKIAVSQEDVLRRAQTLAATYQIPLDKFIKDLQKRDGIQELYDQVAHEKVMEFLENNAKIETVPAK
jgi:trigger factor